MLRVRVKDSTSCLCDLPGTTSRASMGSLYSMKPKPFISFTSVISPVPWVAKWASISALVAVPKQKQSVSGRAMAGDKKAGWVDMDLCEGGCPSRGG